MRLENFDKLIECYDDGKYPEDTYREIIRETRHQGLSERNLKLAILWKYGKYNQFTQGKKYPSQYDKIISRINKNLSESNEIVLSELPRDEKISKLKHALDRILDRIVTKAWIAHIYFPETCRIIDQHNFRAMRYFLFDKKPSPKQKLALINILPSTWDDIHEFEQFFEELKAQNPYLDDRSLDKYLMVYGKRLKAQLKADVDYPRVNVRLARSSKVSTSGVLTLETWGGRSSFRYNGSVDDGTLILYGNKPFRYYVPANDYEDLLEHFGGRVISCGTSRTEPPRGSLGEWLQDKVCKTALASYVGSILVTEGYALKRGDRIEFL